MTRFIAVCSIAVILLQAVITRADEKGNEDQSDPETVDLLISTIDGPQRGIINDRPGGTPFVQANLWRFRRKYSAVKRDEPALLAAMIDENRPVERRLCVASFLLDLDNKDAQSFVVKCLDGELGDAAKQGAGFVLVQEDDSKEFTWRRQQIVKRIEVRDEDDRRDDEAWSAMCYRAGDLKLKEAVDPLIALLHRRPYNRDAALALGSIGDPRAIPILLETVELNGGIHEGPMYALQWLKAPELPKILLRHLENYKCVQILGDIDAKEAIEPLEKLMTAAEGSDLKCAARLALAKLSATDQKDLARRLMEIARTSKDDYERAEAIEHVGPTGERSLVPELLAIAKSGKTTIIVFYSVQAI